MEGSPNFGSHLNTDYVLRIAKAGGNVKIVWISARR